MAVTDLTGYTWVGNNSLNITSSYGVFYIDCSCNDITEGGSYQGLAIGYKYSAYMGGGDFISGSNAFLLGQFDSGSIAGYTITFTGGTDATNSTLISWLESNGTLTAPIVANTYTLTHSLTNLTKGNITIQITPDTNYTYPTTLSVTNGTLVSYDNSTGIAVISGDDTTSVSGECEKAQENFITFSSDSSFTLKIKDNKKYWDGTLEYSTDKSTWATWSGTTTLSSVGNKLYLRGTGNTKITGSTANLYYAYWMLTGSNISCSGNIETLLDYQQVANGQHPTMASYCYNAMFYSCTSLTTAPELPATTMANYCYYSMFQGCTSLTTAPELPATTLANSCYSYMFYGCTSLTTAPSLPATTLANYCYDSMFWGCTSLTTPPQLPATTLASYDCYSNMFRNCTSLYVSDTSTSNATHLWRIPTSGTFSNTSSQSYMFLDCKGTRSSNHMAGASGRSYTYYTQNEPV